MAASDFKFVSPGTQINEIDNSQLPEDQALEEGPIIIGRTRKGPAFTPIQVDSFDEYVQTFGEPVAGVNGGDSWRMNPPKSPMYSTYAAQAWLESNGGATIVRTLGDQSPSATEDGQAGWETDNSPAPAVADNGGAYGLFVSNNPSSPSSAKASGTLAAVFYLQSGSIALSGAMPGGTVTQSAAAYIESSDSDIGFTAVIKDETDTEVEKREFNFNRASSKYIRDVFNTDATKTNSDITPADDRVNYWLGESYERNLESIVTGSASGDHLGVLFALEGEDTDQDGGSYRFENQSADTGWVISQNTQGSSFDARQAQKLFRFHTLNGGKWDSDNLKISIEDIRGPANQNLDYGSFSVVIRRAQDSDGTLQVVESFVNCNLDPTSPNYIARQIGNKERIWDGDDKVFDEYGMYENQSRYVRVEMHPDVENASISPSLVPFGFYGPLKHRGFTLREDGNDPYDYGDSTQFTGAFVKGGGSIPDGPSTGFVDDDGVGITASFDFPKFALRENADQGDVSFPEQAHFGIDTGISATSTRFDRGYSDLVRPLADSYNEMENENDYLERQFIFSMEDLSSSAALGAVYESGSFNAGESISANDTDAWEAVVNSGFDSFTMPLHGGFDGFDETERDPFRNSGISADPVNNYQYYSLAKGIDVTSDEEMIRQGIATMPGITNESLTDRLMKMAENRADTLAIIDLPDVFKPDHEGIITRSNRKGDISNVKRQYQQRGIDNSYATTYVPWVLIRDEYSNQLLWSPPSVLALGAFSNTQNVGELWLAPAGFNRGGLSDGDAGIPALDVSHKLRKPARDELYPVNINPIAQFNPQGIVIFGQKTLKLEDSALDRVNVRRVVNFVKKRISRISDQTLFEANAEETWENFKSPAKTFLDNLKGANGIQDYELRFGRETISDELIDRNAVYGKLLLQPTRTIEFFAIDVVLTNTGAAFND